MSLEFIKNGLIKLWNKFIEYGADFLLKINRDNYKLLYHIPLAKNSVVSKRDINQEEYDLVFVMNLGDHKWVLGAIAREIVAHHPGKWSFFQVRVYDEGKNPLTNTPYLPPLPNAKAYFFMHYAYFAMCLRIYPELRNRKTFVWYTHPKGIMRDEELAFVLNHATKVISHCSQFSHRLPKCGVLPEKVTYAIGAADPDFFEAHERTGDGKVGFCTAYYPRKDPERIFKIISKMPHRDFILIGKNWRQYEKFDEMMALSNLNYVQIPYAEYPKYYAQMDVFVSPAKLEGGPIPLLESMMCNIVPVASNTGLSQDVIEHGKNGFIFDVDSEAEIICDLIESAFDLQCNVRDTVKHLNWRNFSFNVQQIMNSAFE